MVYPPAYTHLSTKRVRRNATTLMETIALPLSQMPPHKTAGVNETTYLGIMCLAGSMSCPRRLPGLVCSHACTRDRSDTHARHPAAGPQRHQRRVTL